MTSADSSYKGFRYPKEIISHAVWLYHRFALSLRDVQELMFERGVVVSHETIRQWCAKFGQSYVFSTLTPRFSVIRAMTTLLSRADILGCHIDGGVPATLDRRRHLHIGRTTYTHTRNRVRRIGSGHSTRPLEITLTGRLLSDAKIVQWRGSHSLDFQAPAHEDQ